MGRKLKDYTGQEYGCWRVIERDLNPNSKSHETFWKAKCKNCGNIASVRKTDLDRCPQFCNNCKGTQLRSWKIGDRYGILTIIGEGKSKDNHTYVTVQCDCNSEPFEVRLEHLKGINRGKTISCGCIKQSAGEIKIKNILEENNILYQQQYRIADFNMYAPFDFAIFNEKGDLIKLIEYDGEQHFRSIEYFGGEEKFKLQQERDAAKNDYCNTHAIFLDRIPYTDYDNINLEMLLRISK